MTPDTERSRPGGADLISHVTGGEGLALDAVGETMWVDVIHRMDEVYSELLRNEADLERKNGELEEAQAFIASVLASVSDALIVCDARLVVRQANAAFSRLVGVAEGARLESFVVEGDREAVRALHAAAQAGRAGEAEIRFHAAAGGAETLALRAAAQFSAEGRRIGFVFTGRPISELKRAYQALREAHVELQQAQDRIVEQEKMASLGRLVAGVAHELNNPISFIYANIHSLRRYMNSLRQYLDLTHSGARAADLATARASLRVDPILDDLQPLLEGTLEGATRVTDIVKNLRRLSFSGSGERQRLDLAKLVRTAVSLTVGGRSPKTTIAVVADDDAYVLGHEGQLHQVLVNLIDNALYAVKDRREGRVEIRVIRGEETVAIVLEDNGDGVNPSHADKIFEPFFTTKTVGEGTGLGLWISFSIVREHGGVLTVRNRPEGGASFMIELPAKSTARDSSPREPSPR